MTLLGPQNLTEQGPLDGTGSLKANRQKQA